MKVELKLKSLSFRAVEWRGEEGGKATGIIDYHDDAHDDDDDHHHHPDDLDDQDDHDDNALGEGRLQCE